MKYSGIIYNDFAAAPGVCLSFFTQGCPHKCKGCHNPETWGFDGGREFTDRTLDSVVQGLEANGIHRNLCIMGGEPLCPENLDVVGNLISHVRFNLDIDKIYIWTGYLYEELKEYAEKDERMNWILSHADILIDGPYIEQERDVTLFMRGSRNQRIIDLKTGKDITNDF